MVARPVASDWLRQPFKFMQDLNRQSLPHVQDVMNTSHNIPNDAGTSEERSQTGQRDFESTYSARSDAQSSDKSVRRSM